MSIIQRLRKCWPTTRSEHGTTSASKEGLRSIGKSTTASSSSFDTLRTNAPAVDNINFLHTEFKEGVLPSCQSQLQLNAVGASFQLVENVQIPGLEESTEVLIKINTVGLNPIDWKAPAFGRGLPSLPCVLGRDLVGVIVKSAVSINGALAVGTIVGGISTDYRDYRKAAFQEYAIASSHNVYRIPSHYQAHQRELASLGVAFVTAALAFGVCLGGSLRSSRASDVELLDIARSISSEDLPGDIRGECTNTVLRDIDRPKPNDWILIWGGGSTVGFVLVQLAKLAGLKVICIADAKKNGSALLDTGVDVIIHRKDPQEAVEVIAGIMQGKELRYGIDTVGKETSRLALSTLRGDSERSKHMVGLVGLPESREDGVHQHKVPIKLFHESPAIGEALMSLLERLLQDQQLNLPSVRVHEQQGLQAVNVGLQYLRDSTFDTQRIVVPIS